MSERFKITSYGKKFEVKGLIDETPLSSIDPIEQGGLTPESKEDLVKLVEAPLLEACQILYDKNIRTLMSSANKKDIGNRKAYIAIDFNSLSEKNKELARSLGEVYLMHGGIQLPAVNIEIPVNESTTIGQIRATAREFVNRFEQQ